MQLGTTFGVANVVVPSGGPKVCPINVDFTNAAAVLLSGEQIITQGKIEYIQGVFIDNSANPVAVSLTMQTTNQKVVCPPNAQGYFSILCPNPVVINAATTQGVVVPMQFYNVPIQPAVWKVA